MISIIIPAYNEEGTIKNVISEIKSNCTGFNYEILVIDDGSTDRTNEIINNIEGIRVLSHKVNKGKGEAIKNGFNSAEGNILLIQDADMEYHPKEINNLVKPLLNNEADVVYGSRFRGDGIKTMSFSHRFGNGLLSFMTRLLYGFKTTDMETGYKVFRKSLIENLELEANSFNIEPELTAIFSKRKARFVEIPISYQYRVKGNAKISWIDGVIGLWWLIKLRFRRYD